METLNTLSPTQKLFFNLSIEKYSNVMGSEPSLQSQLILVDFISEFPLLDSMTVISFSGRIISDKNKIFQLWWEENQQEIFRIFLVK